MKKKRIYDWIVCSIRRFDKELLVMKLISILLFAFALQGVASESYAQMVKINLNMHNATVKQVLSQIETETEFSFLYNSKKVDVDRQVSLKMDQTNIEEVLNQLFAKSEASYMIIDKQIVLVPSGDKLASQQERKITGQVVSEDGEPIVGATIVIKGTTIGASTDIDGNYSLLIPVNASTLQFSFIGMKTQEVQLSGQSVINITMIEETTGLNEVVVTALGIKREQKAIGYITQKVSGSDIVKANTTNIASALSGKVAGVNITNANQLDGGSSRIVLRGNNNIQGNNQPLIVIDGMPLENNVNLNIKEGETSENTSRVRDFGSALNFINSNDIEDMNVLKGPAAAALYGARGANGVILITTKKGTKKDGIGIDYSFTSKITTPYRFRDQQTEYGYGGLHYSMYSATTEYPKDEEGNTVYPKQTWGSPRWDAIYGRMPGGYMTYEDPTFTWHAYSMSWGRKLDGSMIKWWDGEMRPHEASSEGEKYFYRNGITNTHNISFSNGGEFGTVRVGITREDSKSIVDNTDYNRTAFSLGSNLNISKTLSAEVYATYNNYYRHNVLDIGNNDNLFSKYFYIFPTDYKPELAHSMYKKADGSRFDFGNTYGTGNSLFWNLYENAYDYERDNLLGSLNLLYNPFAWLTLSVRNSIDLRIDDKILKEKPTDNLGLQNGFYEHKLDKEVITNTDFLATASKNGLFVEKLNAQFSLGATRWERSFYEISGQTSGKKWFKDPYLYTFGNYDPDKQNGQIRDEQITKEDILNKRINSVFGFIDLSYDNTLFLQLTGRNDWSSTLPMNNNSYFYPSASFSFVFTEAITMPEWFNFGKLRLAYASAATDTDPYQVVPAFSSGVFGGASYTSLKTTLPPVNLKPQRSESIETGINVSLFENRFKFDMTWYQTRSFNQIMEAPVALSSGYNRLRFNTGEMENKGIEIITGYDVIRRKDFDWNIGLNLSKNKNTLLSMSEGIEVFEIGQIFGGAGPVIQVEVGDSYGNIYGWDYLKNEQGQKIIEVIYDKTDATKVIGTKYKTTPERVKLGNITPDFIGGISSSLRWKNLSFSCLADFSFGSDLWSGTYATSLSSGLSPSTLLERNGGGLPYTYPDGTTANHGVKMDGVLEDGTPNNHVVHYAWKYGRLGSWGVGNLTTPSVLDNDWIKLREVSVYYDIPQSFVRKTKVFQSLGVGFTGRDLFYLYSSLPDNLNPEALSNSAGNAQGLEFGALPGTRSFSFTLKAAF